MEIDKAKLWHVALHGSVTNAAMALVILDKEMDGKISELKNKVLGDKDASVNSITTFF